MPYLDVVAALNEAGDRLTLFVVNRHLERDIPTEVRVNAFQPAAEARLQTLTAAGIYQANDEVRPEAVLPRPGALDIPGPSFHHTFRRASVAVIELRRQ